jgi:hypothetical protein
VYAHSPEWTVSRPHDADELAADRQADEALARLPADPAPAVSSSVPAGFAHAFGRDFSGVRLRTDPAAAEVAAGLRAHAVTIGDQILFGPGAYRPQTPDGRRLLAHELAHVVQGERDGRPRIRRQAFGCADLIATAGAVSLLPGRIVHEIIAREFAVEVPGARSVMIPGASAGPLRTDALCGGDSKVIPPQITGGAAGAGFPDLARQNAAGVLSVAEIKPAAPECLVDGENQLARYIDQGNAQDDAQVAWRRGEGISVVSPMLPGVYPPRIIPVPPVVIRTGWCLPGLLGYAVYTPPRIRVPQEEREKEKKELQAEARRRAVLAAAGATGAVVAMVAGRALWRHFWRIVAERFAVRGAVAVALAAADGPLPFGELADLGLAAVTIVQITIEWNELWRQADALAATGA